MTAPEIAVDREYVSQFDSDRSIGIMVHVGGVPGDADGAVTVTMVNEITNDVVFTRTADHPETGAYAVALTSDDTSEVGSFRLDFAYAVSGVAQSYSVWVYVGPADPAYNALPEEVRDIVESVWERFADGFDSTGGGPYLQMKFQAHFGRGRMARLLRIAVGRLNTIAQPHQTYDVSTFPVAQWGALLEEALYVETLKHLVRSYTEQPDVLLSGTVSRLDRRDYMNRWQSILEEEKEDLSLMLDTFKMANMGLSNVRVLVAGGLYGSLNPNIRTGSMEGRPRFYPVRY